VFLGRNIFLISYRKTLKRESKVKKMAFFKIKSENITLLQIKQILRVEDDCENMRLGSPAALHTAGPLDRRR
jgi:hypothetical protein